MRGTQKTDVAHLPFRGGFGSAPHAGTLDVDTDEVAVGVALRECDGVFALAAAQFQHKGLLRAGILCVPLAAPDQGLVDRGNRRPSAHRGRRV